MTQRDPRYGWAVVAALTVLLAATHGLIVGGISVFDKSILQDLQISRGALKLRDLIQLFSAGAWALAIGFAAERFGPRMIIYLGQAVFAVALFGYAYVQSVTQIYWLHLLLAFAYSSCHVVIVVLIVAGWFTMRRSAALGVILAGESLGGTIFPQIIVRLNAAFGWRESFHLLSAMPIVLALLMLAVLRSPPIRAPRPLSADPEIAAAEALAEPATGFGVQLLRRDVLLVMAAAAGLFYGGGSFAAHNFLFFQDRGFAPGTAATGLSLFFISAFCGKLSGGFLAERWQAPTVWLAFEMLMLIGALGMASQQVILIWPAVLALGLGWGGCYTLTQSILMERFAGPYLGRLSGCTVLVEGLMAGLGSFLTGLMFDRTGAYILPFAIAAALIVLALLASLALVRERGNQARALLAG